MKKKLLLRVVEAITMLCCVFGVVGCNSDGGLGGDANKSEFASGSGTESDPYIIEQEYQWMNISKYPEAHFQLNNDVNLGDYSSVAPIGSNESPFTGTVDGNNHKVSGAKVTASCNAGLFGVLSGATIKNLGFDNSSVHLKSKNKDDNIASFAAVAKKGTIIENCYSEKVSINFTEYSINYVMIGGFAASVESVSSIIYCHSNVNIGAPSGSRFRIGGFVRSLSGSDIDCCYAKGAISVWGPSGVKVCRIGTFVDSMQNGSIRNMYTEMNINAKGATGVYYFGGYVDDENLEYCLNFSEYQSTPDGRYETCKLVSNGSESVNIYFSPSQYAEANNTLDNSIWVDNKYWKKGRIHPELVTYEEYIEIKNL